MTRRSGSGWHSRGLSEAAGIHLRTRVEDIARPVVVRDSHGEVGIYGIPYLLPDAVMADLGAERSHASVLAAAHERIRADASTRGLSRTVVIAHALVTGGQTSGSERDIRVGGIGDAPASSLAGCSYLALGHLHGQQRVDTGGTTTAGYSGSPLAFSFSERHHHKSVTLAEIDADGPVATELLRTPVPRPLREVRGRLDDLLARAGTIWPTWPAPGSRRCSPTRPGPSRRWSGCARNGRTPSPWSSSPRAG